MIFGFLESDCRVTDWSSFRREVNKPPTQSKLKRTNKIYQYTTQNWCPKEMRPRFLRPIQVAHAGDASRQTIHCGSKSLFFQKHEGKNTPNWHPKNNEVAMRSTGAPTKKEKRRFQSGGTSARRRHGSTSLLLLLERENALLSHSGLHSDKKILLPL